MAKNESEDDASILEAVDNLSSMAELDIDPIKGGLKDTIRTTRWLDPVDEKKTIEAIKDTLIVVANYLKQIHKKNAASLKDKSIQKGIVSIMNLAKEAVGKVEKYAEKSKKKINIKNSKEYVLLIEFYEKKIKSRFEGEESKDVETEREEDLSDIKDRGVRDVQSVIRDRDYELFYLKNENGGRFFDSNLARHIRLISDFDVIISAFAAFDPLTKVPFLKDDIAYHLCRQLKIRLKSELDDVVRAAGRHKDDPLVQSVFRASMALLLSSNAKNQLKIATGKSVSGYFKDFQTHLREALGSIDYRNYIDNPPEEELYEKVLHLLHRICFVMFTSYINTTEAGALLSQMIGTKEKGKTKSTRSSSALWNTILDDYENLAETFKNCPNGPLFKVLDILTEVESFLEFDPLLNGDFPGNYFSLDTLTLSTEMLKIPSPTMQNSIKSADLSFEFIGFLRALVASQKKLLFFNFQDRTSWKDFARVEKIEKCSLDGEVGSCLTVISLNKSTSFYHQVDEYLHSENATDFLHIFISQLEGGESCGYYFPKKINKNAFFTFAKKMMEQVHSVYFNKKEILSRKNRLDFIEITYHMIYLYFIKEITPDYTAFSSKDGADVSAIELSSFFAFLKTVSGELEWKAEEEDFLVEMIYSSALIVRERAPFQVLLTRAASMHNTVIGELEVDKKKIEECLKDLFGETYHKIKVQRYN